jgi:deoxyribodipyrimidine photolyase
MSSGGARQGSGLVWYKGNDLRLHDHQALTDAHKQHDSVLHAFIGE